MSVLLSGTENLPKTGILRRSRIKKFSNLSQCSGWRGKIQGGRSAGFSAGRTVSEKKNTDVNNAFVLDCTIDKSEYSPTPVWDSSSLTRWTPSLVSESAAASPVYNVFLTRHNEETNHSRKFGSKQDPFLMIMIHLHSAPFLPNHWRRGVPLITWHLDLKISIIMYMCDPFFIT